MPTCQRATLSTIDRYFNYEGNLSVSGSVGPISTDGTRQTAFYSLTGVDPLCLEDRFGDPGPKANSCGVHIHKGESCDADAEGHYFTGAVTEDPWTKTVYSGNVHSSMLSECIDTTLCAIL